MASTLPRLACDIRNPSDVCRRLQGELKSFSFMAQADFDAIAPYFEFAQAPRGTLLWQEGEPAQFCVFITEGHVELKKNTTFNDHQVVIALLGHGAIAGELALLDGLPQAATAEVIEDAELIILTRQHFNQLIVAHPALGIKLLRGILLAVSTRLRQSYERLTSVF